MAPRSVSVVVPVRGDAAATRLCLDALVRHTPSALLEVIVVENGPDPGVERVVRDAARRGVCVVHVVNERNEGFGHACNRGLLAATGERLCLLNNDVLVTPSWFERLDAHLCAGGDVGAVGPRSNRVSGPQRLAGLGYRDLDSLDRAAEALAGREAGRAFEVARLVGLCLLLRRELVERVGGFDPCFFLGNFEDDDLSLRALRAGFRLRVACDAFVHHEGSRTFRAAAVDWRRLMEENWLWFRWKWGFQGRLGEPYPALRLARARPFDPRRDAVPLDEARAFARDLKPLPLALERPRRTLLFAEPLDAAWPAAARERLAAAGPDDLLLVRAEPPLEEHVAAVAGTLRDLERAFPEAAILLDATPLPAAERGRLFAAATEVLLPGAHRDPLHEREARLGGRPVLRAAAVGAE